MSSIPRGLSITHPITIARASGARVWDDAGKEYLDFVGGIGVLNVGHCHPRVVSAVRDQAERLMHMCFQVANYQGYFDLTDRLSALMGDGHKAILFTTGTEAVENAVKIARAYTGRPAVIGFTGGFHGRTLLSLTLTTSSLSYRQNFGPFAPEVYHVPFPYEYRGQTTADSLDALRQLFETRVAPTQVAAMIVEPQLGEGGFVPAPLDFLPALRDITRTHGIALIVDEVQSGFGRTGRMFGFEHYGIDPDLVAMAKSLGGGLPLSAVVGKAPIMDAPEPGGLGGTYAGNPVACAAALAVLDVFRSEDLVARAGELGVRIRERLAVLQREIPQIGDVRGLGCMLAIELVTDRASRQPDAALAQAVVEDARRNGLLLLRSGSHKNVVRLLPPLTIAQEDLDRGLDILAEALQPAVVG
jgi:4-aminobutyrate aminotransferase / (S)-3-amino-2-methylpropionate transaminase / 5-aminovalerate transaminase